MIVLICGLKVFKPKKLHFKIFWFTVIKENDEILCSYGAQYIYPPEYPTNFETVL